jgi:hypothetical protein
VSQHYRQSGDFGLAFVREHLRGACHFQWSDLFGEILVSGFDLEKNELFRQQASEWRAKRKHNTVHVPSLTLNLAGTGTSQSLVANTLPGQNCLGTPEPRGATAPK